MKNRVMKSIFLLSSLLSGLSLSLTGYAANSDEHVVWQKAPIEINLPVGQERYISFPSSIQFGYDANDLPASMLRVENNNQTLYLTAKQAFPLQRVEAKLINGEIILMDLTAKEGGDDASIDIVLPQANPVEGNSTHSTYTNDTNINYISLIRYAVQQLYAPERLINHAANITRFPMSTSHVVPLVYDNSISAMPLASWRDGDLYVTAILIKNQLHQALRLDPRLICGNWQAATFYPKNKIAARGTPINRDTSTLFVVSNRPFAEAMQSCLH